MKKIFTLITLLAFVLGAMAQGQYFYEWKDGKYVQRSLAEVDSITFSLPESAEKAYKYVDLGLPSGTLWADRNVGAASPEAYGYGFAWGETTTNSHNGFSTYKWCKGSYDTLTKYNTKSHYGTVDNKTVLDLEDDAAYVNMGKEWRMPTYDELYELRRKCTWIWIIQNGVCGYELTGPNGNSIFLPSSCDDSGHSGDCRGMGEYWSSSLTEESPLYARNFNFSKFHYGFDIEYYYYRWYRKHVRAVLR